MQRIIILFITFFLFSMTLVAQEKKVKHYISPKLGVGYNGEFLIAELDYIVDYNFAKKWRASSEIGFFNRYWLARQSEIKKPSFYGTGGALQMGYSYKERKELFLRIGYFYFDLENSVYSLGIGYDFELSHKKARIQ